MKKSMTLPWNAAAYRQSHYAPRVHKVCDPVGAKRGVDDWQLLATCQTCGYHVCSCYPYSPPFNINAGTYPTWKQSIEQGGRSDAQRVTELTSAWIRFAARNHVGDQHDD